MHMQAPARSISKRPVTCQGSSPLQRQVKATTTQHNLQGMNRPPLDSTHGETHVRGNTCDVMQTIPADCGQRRPSQIQRAPHNQRQRLNTLPPTHSKQDQCAHTVHAHGRAMHMYCQQLHSTDDPVQMSHRCVTPSEAILARVNDGPWVLNTHSECGNVSGQLWPPQHQSNVSRLLSTAADECVQPSIPAVAGCQQNARSDADQQRCTQFGTDL